MVVSQREPGHLTDHTTLSPFDAGERDAFDEGPLGEREDDDHGQDRHRIARHGQIPKGAVSIEEVGQAQSNGEMFLAGEKDEGGQVVAPHAIEFEQGNGRQDRLGEREDDACEDA